MKDEDAMIKHLKESLEADENEEVEIDQETVKTNHKCNACDKIFRKSQHLEGHVEAKHEDKECTYRGKLFTSKQDNYILKVFLSMSS